MDSQIKELTQTMIYIEGDFFLIILEMELRLKLDGKLVDQEA